MTFILLFLLLPFSLFSQDVNWDDEILFFEDEGITIVGTAQTTQQMTVVDREEIERRGAADIAGLLNETLGLNIVRYGAYGNQAGINLRGFDSKRVSFLIDGIPVNSPLDGKFDINQIDVNSIERIEVIYGGSDSKFNVSGALGGVINIITVKKQKQGLRLGGMAANTSAMPGEFRNRSGETQSPRWEDLLDTQKYLLFASYGGEKVSVSADIFANSARNHFLFTDYNDHTRRKDNNEVRDAGASASAVWELPGLTKLITSSKFYYGGKNFPTSGFSSNFGSQQDFSICQNLLLDMPRIFRDDLAAEVSLAWRFGRMNYTSPADAVSSHDLHSINLINRWNWYPGEKLTLRSGVDYSAGFLNSTEMGIQNRHDGGIYLTAEFSPVKKFLITPSLKTVLMNNRETKVSLIPKLGLLWSITDSLAIRNNYFRSFKFPDFEELYWSGGGGYGNPDLLPEDGFGIDLGFTLNIKELINLESIFFTQWTKNSIHWYSGSTGTWRPENVGEAFFWGFENKISTEIPLSFGPVKKIVPAFSYKYLRSYLLNYGYTFKSNKRIPYNPEHTITGSFDFIWESGSLLVSGNYESIRFNDTANYTMLKPYFLLNANVNQKASKNITIFGILHNILNASYQSFYDYPMPGFTLTIGLRINIEVKNE